MPAQFGTHQNIQNRWAKP
ncbi:hypothetical protein NXF25_003138 [Crotalus adamanteus]|uniref:Uncharacterized protein n=1 Tax=Crotalus adamanteus TaxID=8729 RepID=A0AAW1CED4_CROAD